MEVKQDMANLRAVRDAIPQADALASYSELDAFHAMLNERVGKEKRKFQEELKEKMQVADSLVADVGQRVAARKAVIKKQRMEAEAGDTNEEETATQFINRVSSGPSEWVQDDSYECFPCRRRDGWVEHRSEYEIYRPRRIPRTFARYLYPCYLGLCKSCFTKEGRDASVQQFKYCLDRLLIVDKIVEDVHSVVWEKTNKTSAEHCKRRAKSHPKKKTQIFSMCRVDIGPHMYRSPSALLCAECIAGHLTEFADELREEEYAK